MCVYGGRGGGAPALSFRQSFEMHFHWLANDQVPLSRWQSIQQHNRVSRRVQITMGSRVDGHVHKQEHDCLPDVDIEVTQQRSNSTAD